MGQLQYGRKPVARKLYLAFDGHAFYRRNRLFVFFAKLFRVNLDKKKKSKCSMCGDTDDYRYHSGSKEIVGAENAGKEFCQKCWPLVQQTDHRIVIVGDADRAIERNLPKNHILGPKREGMRGVFERVKR